MSELANTLLISEPAAAQGLARSLRLERCRVVADPYDALATLHQKAFASVIVAGQGERLPGLCRAARRVRPEARVIACVPPHQADQVAGQLPIGVEVLAGDLRRPIDKTESPVAIKPPPARNTFTTVDLVQLMRSAVSVPRLEAALGRLIRQRIGCEARWVDRERIPPETVVLLETDCDRPRSMLAERFERDLTGSEEGYLADLRTCLSALVSAAKRMQSLQHLAITDDLTGLANRRHFYQRVEVILRRVAQSQRRATLVLFDVDDFKHYNDTYGHAAGDEILRETAAMMRQTMREHDVVARIGGDEFAALLWEESPPREADSQPIRTALELVERFHRAVAERELPMLGPEARGALTMSGGAAVFPTDGRNCRELLRSADRALRQAKQAGKDAIHLVGQLRR
ncbi:MAG: GGDEF domain-containing protein [Planctomycetota bacterium]